VVYIDDLTTLPEARGKGFARALLDWLIAHTKDSGCDAVHLDTGYGRHAAHRLYLSRGFELNCHHMAVDLRKPVR
jgi:GNAT superfamily N-acetyltransferase